LRVLEVDAGAEGDRLDVWLARASGRVRSEVQRMIASGMVSVDGGPATKSMRVVRGQSVRIAEPPPAESPPPSTPDIEVRFEDEHLAVVNKPAGLVVHSAAGSRAPTLVDALRQRMPLAPAAGAERPGIVHRLDKGTSGLIVVAKTDEAYAGLVSAMKEQRIDKTYLTLVEGTFSVPRGRIEAPIGRSQKNPMSMAIAAGGRPSVTEFEVLETLGTLSHLKVFLKTGRTHQIRVHLAHIKHPVVGDRRYGGGAEHPAERLGLDRPFLHAAELSFEHPVTGERLHLEEPLPDDLRAALAIARGAGVRR
jgi:23S rRNA pseudouridine1911/1915/1917 synthase